MQWLFIALLKSLISKTLTIHFPFQMRIIQISNFKLYAITLLHFNFHAITLLHAQSHCCDLQSVICSRIVARSSNYSPPGLVGSGQRHCSYPASTQLDFGQGDNRARCSNNCPFTLLDLPDRRYMQPYHRVPDRRLMQPYHRARTAHSSQNV